MARQPGPLPKVDGRSHRADAADPAWASQEDIQKVRSRLTRREAVWWFEFMAETTLKAGLLTTVDLPIFANWAEAKAAWEIFQEQVTAWEAVLVAKFEAGTKESPEEAGSYPRCYALRNSYEKKLRELEAKMGFSPADRTRIAAASSQADLFRPGVGLKIVYSADMPERGAA